MVHGKHQFSFGGEYVRSQLNINNLYESNGNYTFSGVYSQKGPAGNGTTGSGQDTNLDFLTGALNAYQQSKAQQNALRAPIPSLYFQDTYHATTRLVLSAGVRWDPEYMPVDYFHRGTYFDSSDFISNVHSTVFPNAPAGALFYGDRESRRGLLRTHRGSSRRVWELPSILPEKARPCFAWVRP